MAEAIKLPQSAEYCCMKDWMPTGIVMRLSSLRNTLEIKNSLYEKRNEKIATAAIPGAARGRIICKNPRKGEQPST